MMGATGRVMMPGEVADLLRVSTRTVYGLLAEGEITHLKVNRMIRIPRESVERYIERQTRTASGEVGGEDDLGLSDFGDVRGGRNGLGSERA